jgi:hypothetical protein
LGVHEPPPWVQVLPVAVQAEFRTNVHVPEVEQHLPGGGQWLGEQLVPAPSQVLPKPQKLPPDGEQVPSGAQHAPLGPGQGVEHVTPDDQVLPAGQAACKT